MNETTNNMTPNSDIMHYESDIWEVADLLLAAGIKQSDFPKFMMPFFALVMLEGRMLNAVKKYRKKKATQHKTNQRTSRKPFGKRIVVTTSILSCKEKLWILSVKMTILSIKISKSILTNLTTPLKNSLA